MLPRNLNLNIGKKEGYNNKILVSNTDMKIGSKRDINRDRKKIEPTGRAYGSDPCNNSAQSKNAYQKA